MKVEGNVVLVFKSGLKVEGNVFTGRRVLVLKSGLNHLVGVSVAIFVCSNWLLVWKLAGRRLGSNGHEIW